MDTQQISGFKVLFREIHTVQKNWGWFLALGILLILIGFASISFAVATTLFSVFFLGIVLAAAGITQIIHGFWAHEWRALFLSIFVGILYLVTGVICFISPVQSAVSLTLLIAILCFVGGLFKMISSLTIRFDQWGWVFINGLITFLLGILIYNNWPESGLWVIGLFIGIDLILAGWTWVVLALAAHNHDKAVNKR